MDPNAAASDFAYEANGSLFVNRVLVSGEVYSLTTTVRDRSNPTLQTAVAVVITVIPAANLPPQFIANDFTIFVSEGVPLNTEVWRIPVSDNEGEIITLTYPSIFHAD